MIDNHLKTNFAINHNHNEFLTTSANRKSFVVDYEGYLTTTLEAPPPRARPLLEPHYHDVQGGRWYDKELNPRLSQMLSSKLPFTLKEPKTWISI